MIYDGNSLAVINPEKMYLMPAPRNKKYLFAILTLMALCGLWFLVTTPGRIEKAALYDLRTLGFQDARIGHAGLSTVGTVLTDIRLDKDGYSTLETLLLKKGFFSSVYNSITISDLSLSGDFSIDTGLAINGWTPKIRLTIPDFDNLLLNKGHIDIATKQGSIRFEAEGRATCKNHEKKCVTDARLWGKQNQLVLDSRWKITTTNQAWNAESEIMDARINIDRLSASRISGWINFEKSSPTIPLPIVSGQIVAGQIRLGQYTSFFSVSMTIEKSEHIIIQSQPSQNGSIGITADIRLDGPTPVIDASLTAPTGEALLSFLKNIEKDTSFIPLQPAVLAALMLTPGNLNRIEKALSGLDYENVELKISGPLYDLGGKIITKRTSGDTEQQQVISLNPAQ